MVEGYVEIGLRNSGEIGLRGSGEIGLQGSGEIDLCTPAFGVDVCTSPTSLVISACGCTSPTSLAISAGSCVLERTGSLPVPL